MSDDREALQELLRHIAPGVEQTIRHYLYLPSAAAARDAAAVLRAKGFDVQDRRGADGINWLVLARHRVVPSLEAIASTRLMMEQLVAPRRGEYDGWEADLASARN
jgi:hypothetical protein